jgi:hypothetical protein
MEGQASRSDPLAVILRRDDRGAMPAPLELEAERDDRMQIAEGSERRQDNSASGVGSYVVGSAALATATKAGRRTSSPMR